MADTNNPQLTRRLRGCILRLLRANHDSQQTRMDDVAMTHALQSLAYIVGVNIVVTLLQDLQDRGYVRFRQGKDFFTGRQRCEKIELTAKGRDLVEENIEPDRAVEF